MRHKKLIILGLIILFLMGAGLVYQNYQKGKNSGYETVVVKRGDIAQKVSGTGRVEPKSSLDLQFISSGKVSEVKAKVGDRVKAGQILVSLDTTDLNFQAQAQAAALQSAQAKLAQLLAGASQEDVSLAQTAVANAQNSLDDAKKSFTDSQGLAQNSLADVLEDWQRTLQATNLTAQNSLRTDYDTLYSPKISNSNAIPDLQVLGDAKELQRAAETQYAAAKPLVDSAFLSVSEDNILAASEKMKLLLSSLISALSKTNDVLNSAIVSPSFSQNDLDNFKADILSARTNANTALTNLISGQQAVSQQKISNQANLTAGQAKVVSAQGGLESAKDQLALKLAKPRQADIDLRQAEIAQAQASLNQIKNQIAQKSLAAPIDGIATSVDIERGEIVSLGKTVVSLDSLSDFEIKSDIVESDIAKVKIGDSVAVTFDALGENEVFEGRVVKINPSRTIVAGVVYYQATIGLQNSSAKIKPRISTSADPAQRGQIQEMQKLYYGVKSGMTANLEVVTDKHEGALIVPARTVKEADGKKIVKILQGGQIKEKPVQIGLKNDQGEVEIVEGLEEGERVVIVTID